MAESRLVRLSGGGAVDPSEVIAVFADETSNDVQIFLRGREHPIRACYQDGYSSVFWGEKEFLAELGLLADDT